MEKATDINMTDIKIIKIQITLAREQNLHQNEHRALTIFAILFTDHL